ncbi:MAG TPA: hypothetical protein VMB25_17990, partial [Bryobacteraceae bacterium]|nr:hypothetical protein [Bryobacteraceae bacterium]
LWTVVPFAASCQEPENSALTIRLTSPLGGTLPSGNLTISRQGRSVLATTAKDEYVAHLPYGRYTIRFTAKFLRPVQREVEVNRPEQFLILAADPEDFVLDLPMKPVGLSIRVTGRPCSGRRLWAKLVGVYTDYSSERLMSPLGFALFDSITPGAYILAIIDGDRVRATQSVATRGPLTTVGVSLVDCK